MQNFLILNASPRSNGTSKMLAGLCRGYLEGRGGRATVMDLYGHGDWQSHLEAFAGADTVVIAGPCYVNTYPADVTRFLETLAAHPETLRGQKLYGIIQGGMPYAHTHKSGLDMLAVFAGQTGLQYQGGFVMGLGAMLDGQPLDRLPNGRKTKRQFELFLSHVFEGSPSEDAVYEKALMRFPKPVARFMAFSMNRSTDRAFAKQGFDATDPSPYLSDELLPYSS